MRTIIRFLAVLLITTLGFGSAVRAELPNARSLLLLASPKGACATGFLLKGDLIVTNAHVVDGICDYGDCSGVEIYGANTFGKAPDERLSFKKLSAKRIISSFDIAVLEVKGLPFRPPIDTALIDNADLGSTATVLGYPGCKSLEQSSGKLKNGDTLHVETELKGSYGSSGSPVFNQDGKIVGVAIQAESLFDAAQNVSLGTPFPLRIVRANFLKDILEKNEEDLLNEEVSILLEYYDSHVSTVDGLDRVMKGFQFIATLNGLRTRVLSTPALSQYYRPFLWYDDYLNILPLGLPAAGKNQELLLKLEELLTALNVEINGPNARLFHPADLTVLKRALEDAGYPEKHSQKIEGIVKHAIDQKFPGSQMLQIKYGLYVGLVIIVIAALWGLSVSYVFCRSLGNVVIRFFKALLVGILLWPLSFLIYLMSGSKKDNYDSFDEPPRPLSSEDYSLGIDGGE